MGKASPMRRAFYGSGRTCVLTAGSRREPRAAPISVEAVAGVGDLSSSSDGTIASAPADRASRIWCSSSQRPARAVSAGSKSANSYRRSSRVRRR